MMDHYEELGIERSASVAEIRHAYRRLMQLLHPDHCGDEASRRLAELQAKRLNAMLAVLTDPVERERYDRELIFNREGPALPQPPPSRLSRAPAWLWPVAGAAMVLALVSQMVGPPRGAPAAEPAGSTGIPAPPAPAPKKQAIATVRRGVPAPVRSPRIAIAQGARPGGAESANNQVYAAPHIPQNPPVSAAPSVVWDPPALVAPALTEPPPPIPRSSLAGEWLFVPQPNVHSEGLYPPEFIELRLTEESGWMRGKYRARYRVADRAISPGVTFEFEGWAGENEACLPWSGPGGARGEVTLRLLDTGALEVTWVVSHLGTELGLISGTATLVRRVD